MRIPVRPDANGIISVRHDLGSEDLVVRCFSAEGDPVGYAAATLIGPNELEVLTVPGSGVTAVEVVVRTDSGIS